MWGLTRTLVKGEDDLTTARALQQQYTLTPLSAYGGGIRSQEQVPPSPITQTAESNALQFYDELGAALQDDPPPEDESPLLRLFAQVGIDPSRRPSQEVKDQATIDGLKQAISEGERLIDQKVSNWGKMVNGWMVNYQPHRQFRQGLPVAGRHCQGGSRCQHRRGIAVFHNTG